MNFPSYVAFLPQLDFSQLIPILVGIFPLARTWVQYHYVQCSTKMEVWHPILECSRYETSFKLLVHVCLRFTLWCICHFVSIWFNLISVPGHPAVLCAFSVTIAYGVRPTDSSANEGGLNSYFLDGFANLATYLKKHISFHQFFPVLSCQN